MQHAFWIAIGVLVFAGLLGILRAEYVGVSSGLLLVGLALALRKLTWGRDD